MPRPTLITRVYFHSARFAILNLLLAYFIITSAQSISSTDDRLPDYETKSSFVLRLSAGSSFDGKSYMVVPLTVAAGMGQNAVAISTYDIQGYLKFGLPTSNITDTDMAFVCCDANNSTVNPTEVMIAVAAQSPQAIVLYSQDVEACTHSGDFGYQSIYSMISKKDSRDLLSRLSLSPSSVAARKAIITPSSTSSFGNPVMDTNNEGGPAPTTAVAMSILYSITGIITLLFLIIIATGAIRAHRHPERYGPRNTGIPGRPRQSRAEGIARAILETLPIVKFGDPIPIKEVGNSKLEGDSSHPNLENLSPLPPQSDVRKAEKAEPILNNSMEDNYDKHENDLGCSICTEDFIAGEDLRVLPCNHKYHPVCIDPWLLDVCGTCPLCRHDLRTVKSNPSETTSPSGGRPPPLSEIDVNRYAPGGLPPNPQRNRITRILDLDRLRQALPDRSIPTLRVLRQQTRNEPAQATTEDIEETRRSALLIRRLKNLFRIKTRAQASDTPL